MQVKSGRELRQKRCGWCLHTGTAFVAFLLVALFVAGCAGLPLPGRGGVVARSVSQLEEKTAHAHIESVQESLESLIGLAQNLQASHELMEMQCRYPHERGVSKLLLERRVAHAALVFEGKAQLIESKAAIARARAWIDAVSPNAGASKESLEKLSAHLDQAQDGMQSMDRLLTYEDGFFAMHERLGAAPDNPQTSEAESYYDAIWAALAACLSLDAPVALKDVNDQYAQLWETVGTVYYDLATTNSSSELDRRTLFEVMDWTEARDAILAQQQSWISAQHYRYIATLLAGTADVDSVPQVEFTCVERIAPNLYQSLDSVLNATITTARAGDVVVEVEIPGFTQAYTTKLSLEPGVNHIRIKPELLPGLTRGDLENASTTQINFKMTDTAGTIIEQQSRSVEVLSIYDYIWENDEFGFAAQFELFAWLRPGQEVVTSLNRRAAEYMGEWTDGQFAESNGYQYGEDWYMTLLQVAAIQKAFSDSDIAYVLDTYTPTADQRVLTPSAVFDRRQALCVESAVVMASALLSAGMHPMIVVLPTHAQVAVETWKDSGQYFLIETSALPYGGVDFEGDPASAWSYGGLVPTYDDGGGTFSWVESTGSSDTWVRYFDYVGEDTGGTYDGIFVLDCYLQRYMDIRGLESM